MHPRGTLYSKASRTCRYQVGSSDPAVAVLEFLARTAGARRIARRAGPGRARAGNTWLGAVGPISRIRPACGAGRRLKEPAGGAGGARLLGHCHLRLGSDRCKHRLRLHAKLDMT